MASSRTQLFPAYPLSDYLHLREGIELAIRTCLERGHYILGEQVDAFERALASYMGCTEGIGVANGTDSIELLLRALDVGPGCRVAVPSHTAVASVSAIQRAGATPVFIDIDEATFTLDPVALEEALTSVSGEAIRAVLAVHLYGHPCDMQRLEGLCAEHGCVLLEDCAQAHGAMHRGRKVGSIGRGASFSFYPTKNLGAIGDGGAVTTSDPALADRVRCLRQYGWRERYISAEMGINSRLDELQAAILQVKLPHLERAVSIRRRLAGLYGQLLAECPQVQVPVTRNHCEHAWHLYVIRCERRDELLRHLNAQGIPAAQHYPAAVHQQPAYAGIAARSAPLPRTEQAVKEILTLPLHPYLSDEAVAVTAQAVREFYFT